MSELLYKLPEKLEGQNIIDEAIKLVQNTSFTINKGILKTGDNCIVTVDPRMENNNLQALVSCYAFGHRIVDWEKCNFFITDIISGQKYSKPLDNQGQCIFTFKTQQSRYSCELKVDSDE